MVRFNKFIKGKEQMQNKKNLLLNLSFFAIIIPIILYYFVPHTYIPTFLKNGFTQNLLAGISTMGFGSLFTYFIVDQHYKIKKQEKYNKLTNYIIETLIISANNILENFIWSIDIEESERNTISDKIYYQKSIGVENLSVIENYLLLKVEQIEPLEYTNKFIRSNGWNLKKIETISPMFFNVVEEQIHIDYLSNILLDTTKLYELTLNGKDIVLADSNDTKDKVLSLIKNIIILRDFYILNKQGI